MIHGARSFGREATAAYNETTNGRLPLPNTLGAHQFPVPLPHTDAAGNLLPLIYGGDPGVPGAGDGKVQAYNFRLCLTQNESNLVPISRPDGCVGAPVVCAWLARVLLRCARVQV